MNAEPKPYLLPQLRDIGRGAGVGAIEGLLVGAGAGPASIVIMGFWFAVAVGSTLLERITEFGAILVFLAYAALVGVVMGGILGGIAGGSIYLVLQPFLPPERWPEMDAALRRGLRWGAIAAQIFAAAVPGLAFGPWAQYVTGWLSSPTSDLLVLLWVLLVPCGFVLGGFINVARLMRPVGLGGEESG